MNIIMLVFKNEVHNASKRRKEFNRCVCYAVQKLRSSCHLPKHKIFNSCEIWFLTLMEEPKLLACGNSMQENIWTQDR
jgi:hypothetical protein